MRALAVLCTLEEARRNVALALLQDAVLAAASRSQTPVAQVVTTLLARGMGVYVSLPDLSLRGISADDLTPGTIAVDDSGLADLLLTDGTRVLGSF
jgi:sulfur transfer complex TusBCD TusB component (DsrH family)